MKIKKYRSVLNLILLLCFVFIEFNDSHMWIEISEGYNLIVKAIIIVSLIALSISILVSPNKPKE